MAARFDSSGYLNKADADTEWPLTVRGLVTKTTKQYFTANAFRGRAYVDGITGLTIGARLWLSKTIGLLSDVPVGVDELQTLTIGGTPTGGTFTLTFMGCTTATIAYNATAAAVQAALSLLSSIGLDNVLCGGGALPGAAVTIQFRNGLGFRNLPIMTGSITGLTGGTPTFAMVETTPGVNDILVAKVVPLWDGTTVRNVLDIL
jgi:hypothetical protein